MISIFSSEKGVYLNFRHGLVGCEKQDVQLSRMYCSEIEAAAVSRALNEHFTESVKAMAKRMYEKGWADAKARRRKEDYFSGWIRPASEAK